jgi:hypothetical protein
MGLAGEQNHFVADVEFGTGSSEECSLISAANSDAAMASPIITYVF